MNFLITFHLSAQFNRSLLTDCANFVHFKLVLPETLQQAHSFFDHKSLELRHREVAVRITIERKNAQSLTGLKLSTTWLFGKSPLT